MLCVDSFSSFFFFNSTATTEIYTLSLHDALPISMLGAEDSEVIPILRDPARVDETSDAVFYFPGCGRSEAHTSELQSHHDLVCRLLLEKKKKIEEIGIIGR